ncbi:MAG: hypothetical protein RL757_2748, partial [Bacteroidota bacterium]
FSASVFGQKVETDTAKAPPPVSAAKIGADSSLHAKKWVPKPSTAFKWAIIPGGGQIYNRKWAWLKTPIVWGGMGTGIYLVAKNYNTWQRYKTAYYNSVNGLPNEFPTADPQRVKAVRDANYLAYQQAIFVTSLLYLLQGAEAFTAAHLMSFDLSDDLSVRVQPSFQPFATGIGVSFQF